MIELLRELTGTTATDTILDHYLSKSIKSIQSYLNYKEEEMVGLFETQIVDLAMFYYKQKSNIGIIQQSQGSRSMTLERGIPKEIKDSLPLPRVRIVGGR